jgi:hypothetical protein
MTTMLTLAMRRIRSLAMFTLRLSLDPIDVRRRPLGRGKATV